MNPHAERLALVVEDHPLYRSALVDSVLGAGLGLRCHTASSLAEARRAVRDRGPYVLLLSDQRLPDGEGLQLLVELASRVPVRVLLAGTDEARIQNRARLLGLDAYLCKAMPPGTMVQVLQAVMAGQRWFPPRGQAPASDLTERQLEVLRLAARGLSSREIAAALGLVESTVKDHFSLIFIRLGVRNRAEAVAQASASGLLACDAAG
jgi:DNA-binding NarL/FixJ family response regulator